MEAWQGSAPTACSLPGVDVAWSALPGAHRVASHRVRCLQAGGLERGPEDAESFRETNRESVNITLGTNALHGVMLVGDLSLGPRGELPVAIRAAWLDTAREISMGDDW